jgi:hypothetical protein
MLSPTMPRDMAYVVLKRFGHSTSEVKKNTPSGLKYKQISTFYVHSIKGLCSLIIE